MRRVAYRIGTIARKVRTYRHFSREERILVRRAIALLCAARVGLWLLPLRRVKAAAERLAKSRRLRVNAAEQQLGWAIRVAARCVPGASCLPQALAAQVLLTWYGYPSRLHIGVALEGRFEAHAWVECNGLIVVGGADESARYTPILAMTNHDK
jgi:Transglutaminase-like superfamily